MHAAASFIDFPAWRPVVGRSCTAATSRPPSGSNSRSDESSPTAVFPWNPQELPAITRSTVFNYKRRSVIKETAISWSNHRCSMMGAALAYYSIFSFGPLLVISTAVAGLVFGPDAVQGEIAAQVEGLLGSAGAQALETLLAAANRPYQGALATIFGIGTLLFAAVGVVAQLKEALNTVWGVETANGGGILQLIRRYVISLAGVLSLGFLLLVSLIFTAALAAIGKFVAPYFPEAAFQITGSLVSFCFVTILFA